MACVSCAKRARPSKEVQGRQEKEKLENRGYQKYHGHDNHDGGKDLHDGGNGFTFHIILVVRL